MKKSTTFSHRILHSLPSFPSLLSPLALFTLLLLLTTSCSKSEEEKPRYNKTETRELINTYDANKGKLTPEQYSRLIANTRLLFAELKQTLKLLSEIAEPLRFTQEYEKLKNDKEFFDKLTDREQAWRVLVLGQKDFSAQNRTEFSDLPRESWLIDYYDDVIRLRITQAQPEE